MSERRFIEQFEDNVRLYPEKVILRDQDTCLTFRELDELSGRVYAYLKKKGIGREDFVMISLPHGVLPYIAMIGVWKAGAALVMSGENIPEEREKYIYSNCNCKLYVDVDVWEDIKNTEVEPGHSLTSLKDACYAVYTSGSEGKPKGVIHEYGKLELQATVIPFDGDIKFPEDSIEFIPIPVCFAGAIFACVWLMWRRVAIDAGPLSLMQEPGRLRDYFISHKINIATLPPSYFALNNIESPYLKYIQLSMEMANNAYSEKYYMVNSYAQSEGYLMSMFVIDKLYNNTPIGRPTEDENFILVEDDCVVKHGKIGELCYKNPYFRGYINDVDSTAKSQFNGYQRSGDIARINEDGNYVILGRKTDMIKINGNRIEPAEIEAAVKRVLNLDWAFAKGFVEPERSFICVYYTADINIDYARVREELMKILPTYMIPSYFVHIDSIPHLPNGKVDRQAFKAPEVADYMADYIPPTNELEERLCTSMQQVLGLERIGINDDFYLLGGDSLRTIRLVALCDIEGLNVSDIYTSRTPSRIAERWIKKQIMNN